MTSPHALDLYKGQVRNGVVSSVVDYGAFVDLGGLNGLVHTSELSWKPIDHPSEVVHIGQQVTVKVLGVKPDGKRISLSLKATQAGSLRQFERTHAIREFARTNAVGQVLRGSVTKLLPFGAFVRIDDGVEGLVHISELAEPAVEIPEQVVAVGDDLLVKVIDIDLERSRISLSIKQANEGILGKGGSGPAHVGISQEVASANSESVRVQPRNRAELVQAANSAQLLEPTLFLQPGRRLFIDTNVFMDTDARRTDGLKRLFERGQDAILWNDNPIVVPTKVVEELSKQSRINISAQANERVEAIKKAGAALTFLESASEAGLVRTDLGDGTNPYADDLFLRLFERYAGTYEMCLLTLDITIKLRIRMLAHRLSGPLFVGVLTKDGDIQVESNQSLLDRALRKCARHAARVADGCGDSRDESEVVTLTPLLGEFRTAFGLKGSPIGLGGGAGAAKAPAPGRKADASRKPAPFKLTSGIKPPDASLSVTALPATGDRVVWESASEIGTLVLGPMVGEGGEGSVYESGGGTVVKIFDKDHITLHRKEKIELLASRNLDAKGVCIPSALVRNRHGEFVGYVMPKASGRELQRTIFNRRKFEKEFPNWKKADLVDICISFLEQVQYLHSINVLLGDISPKNLMIDDKKHVFVIDADSWQLEGYPCPVGTPMFTSPRMLGKTYSEDLRTMEDERFAVATMLFMIVMTGQFPYIRTGTDGDMVQLIKEGNFAFQYGNRNNRDQPEGDWKYMWSHIHKPVKDMFWHTFHKEGRRYRKRATATEWLESFRAYKAYLGNKELNFDPMSNDVYPIRNKAFRPDTPVQDCPNCHRKNAIAGIWRDDDLAYVLPPRCIRCKDLCKDCGNRSDSLKGGRCLTCDHKHNFGSCIACGSEVLRNHLNDGRCSNCRLLTCKSCGTWTRKSELEHGKCESCRRWENQIDPSRPCVRCGQPFLTNGRVRFFQQKGLTVQKRHKEGTFGCVGY